MPTLRRLLGDRFLVLGTVVFVVMVSHTLQRQWSSDIWEHASVVRELAARPFHPDHPQVATSDPHPFFSPWALGVGLFARLTGLAALDALAVLAPLNLLLVLTGLRAFVGRVSRERHAAFYALLFALLLWGPSPWRFSGFVNLNSLGFVLPYPSTFALGVVLWGLAVFDRVLDRITGADPGWPTAARAGAVLGLVLLSALVLLTHPADVIPLFGGFVAFGAARHVALGRVAAVIGVVVLGGVVLGVLWPYFPLLDVTRSRAFDTRLMYSGAVLRLLPIVVVGGVALVRRARRDARDPLLLFAAGLAFIYLVGGVTGRWSLGRDVAALALILQVAAADLVAATEPAARAWLARAEPIRRMAAVGAVVALVLLSLANVAPALVRAVPQGVLPSSLRVHVADEEARFEVLERLLPEGAVVIAPRQTGRSVPVYGGKVVAPYHPFVFIDDGRRRIHDLKVFFRPRTDEARRRAIIARYGASAVLVDTRTIPDDSALGRSLRALGPVTASWSGLRLIRVG